MSAHIFEKPLFFALCQDFYAFQVCFENSISGEIQRSHATGNDQNNGPLQRVDRKLALALHSAHLFILYTNEKMAPNKHQFIEKSSLWQNNERAKRNVKV